MFSDDELDEITLNCRITLIWDINLILLALAC